MNEFDNLREDAASSYDEVPAQKYLEVKGPAPTFTAKPRSRRILGMTGQQRFILSVMFMLAVCVIGFMALFITGKIGF